MQPLVAGGYLETKNGQVGKCKTTATVAAARKTSTCIGATARLFASAFRPGRMSTIILMELSGILIFAL